MSNVCTEKSTHGVAYMCNASPLYRGDMLDPSAPFGSVGHLLFLIMEVRYGPPVLSHGAF
jgi:hypothetical protein